MNVSNDNAAIIERVYGLFSDLGALKELPGNMQESAGFLMRVWSKLVIENPHWPSRGTTYDAFLASRFFTALTNGSAPRKGNNIAALCQAFKDWYTPHQERALIPAFYARFPHLAPKQIAKPKTTLESWPDSDIRDQYNKIQEIFTDEKGNLFSGITGSEKYFARIMAEYERRFG